MSERTSQRLVDDERAEFSVSALMFLSVVLVSTSILSTFLLSIAERTMVDGRETAHSQSDVVNGIISVTYIELSALNDPSMATNSTWASNSHTSSETSMTQPFGGS